ncbi:MAG: response regulator [Rhodospirillales bacterium]
MTDILIIDDDNGVRQVIADTLAEEGYTVSEAADGAAGLKAIGTMQPRLVICDVRMPKLNGYEVLEKLHETHPEMADMPFIFLSGLSDKDYVKAGYKIGADDYVTKPVDVDLLAMKIGAILKKSAADSASTASKSVQAAKLKKSMDFDGATRRGPASEAAMIDIAPGFEKRLLRAIASGGDLNTGSFQFVSLDEFKEQFGERWPKLKDKAIAICESVMRQAIGQKDSYTRFGETGFMMLFEGMSEEAATKKVKTIAAEIRKRLLGDKESAYKDLNVKTDVVDPRRFVDENGNITAQSLANVFSGRADESEMMRKADGPDWFVQQLGQVYRPVWSAKREKIVTNQCWPTRRTNYAQLSGSHCLHGGPDDEFAIHLDCFMIRRLAAIVQNPKNANVVAPLSVPLNFRSFLDENQELLIESLKQIPENMRARQLMIELTGIPENRSQSTIDEVMRVAGSFTKHVAAELSPDDRHADVFKARGVTILVFALEDTPTDAGGTSKEQLRELKRFGDVAVEKGFHPRVDNIRRMDAFQLARDSGFALIGGKIIGAEATNPRQPSDLSASRILVV